ncbi:MAG: ParB/RepB/Spo0J family partition protein [Syntrophaceae bacterium]
MKPKSRLGRGIDAIFSESLGEHSGILVDLSLDEIVPNPIQPRKTIEDASLTELSESIRANGLISPIVVRRVDSRYEIIAGERRFRAAKMAGLDRIPVIVRECPDDEAYRLSLIENLQREDLNPMEESEAYHTLVKQFHLTHQDIAATVAKDRSTITNALRLMGLPEEAKQSLREGHISTGHARAILMASGINDQLALLTTIRTRNLNVREAEKMATRSKQRPKEGRRKIDPTLEKISLGLSERFSTKVTCLWGTKKGRIVIEAFSRDDLLRIAHTLASEEVPL